MIQIRRVRLKYASNHTKPGRIFRAIKKKKAKRRNLDQIKSWLKRMKKSAQYKLWKDMIDNHPFGIEELISLRTAIEDRIRIDIISRVPYDIALYIMSLLSPKDLCQAAQTCRSWRVVCEDNRLWHEKCKEEGIVDDKQTLATLLKQRIRRSHSIQERFAKEKISSIPKSKWKEAYLKHVDILRNWTTRRFEISEPFISPRPEETEAEAGVPPPTCFRKESAIYTADNKTVSLPEDDISTSDNCFSSDPSSQPDDHPRESPHLMRLRCHEDSVITCLKFNPESNIIVSGSDDHTLKVWSSETGRCINTLEGHTGGVWSSQLSPDDIVISGSTDRTLRVWNARNGESLHTLYGHTSTVRCLALDGNFVVSGSRDTTLRLWDISLGLCVNVFSGHSSAVRCVAFKNDVIVSGAYDFLVMVWDASTGTCRHVLKNHYSRIYSLQFDGRTIASGSLDASICLWDVNTGELRHQLEGHTSLTSKMQLKGNLLVSANADSFCKIWDINLGECLQTLGGEHKHTSAITSVYFNNRHVVTSSDDGTVKLWDIKTGEFIRNLVVLPTAGKGGVVWRIRASYTKLICAVGSRAQTEDTHLLVLNFNE